MTARDFEYVCRVVRDASAIVLEPGKEYLVDARLTPLARDLGLGTIPALVARLRADPGGELRTRVVEAMVTSETSFYRDAQPFEALRTAVLPELFRARAADRALAIWSAGCSTGQEPYTVAVLLREHFPEARNWAVTLLATDLSSENLDRARAGRFNPTEVSRGLPAEVRDRYFRPAGPDWEVAADVRAMVEFRELNLARPWPPLPRMDLILLRNVLIYFDVETKKRVLARAAAQLRPGGLLLLGGAETTYNLCDSFRRCPRFRGGFFERIG